MALFLTLGLMSKSMLVTTPAVLLLLDLWPLGRFHAGVPAGGGAFCRRQIRCFWKNFLYWSSPACSPWHRCWLTSKVLARWKNCPLASVSPIPWCPIASTCGNRCGRANLAVFYPLPTGGIQVVAVLFAAILLSVASWAAWRSRNSHPSFAVGWLWYLGMLVPVIGIVQSGDLARADRYTYLPQIGLCLAGTWAVADWSAHWPHRRLLLGSMVSACLSILLVLTWRQTAFWHDSVTLWTHAFECVPNNSLAHNSIGNALSQQGKVEQAMAHYREAIRIKPSYAEAHNDLAILLTAQGQVREAIAEFEMALRLAPSDLAVENNLAWVLATTADQSLCNGSRAIELAAQSSETDGGNNPMILRTLAAAYAEPASFPTPLTLPRRRCNWLKANLTMCSPARCVRRSHFTRRVIDLWRARPDKQRI